MKNSILTASCAFLFLIVTPVHGQTTLFADSFDRDDDTDLNASATGKSGTLGALDWIEVVSGGNPQISSNNLKIGETGGGGGGWSIAYPDHNFIDSGQLLPDRHQRRPDLHHRYFQPAIILLLPRSGHRSEPVKQIPAQQIHEMHHIRITEIRAIFAPKGHGSC